ncbi:TonB-dependent receptor [Pseudomonas typographi]|uniref:TonB-dependent receptor n=1 Tax=Pseudomonas typographi TaxID=2715964 RepID=A0ABR7YWG8_9PSED|nr:TonB-dependent receptor [Pseudomonas typographi]MBD1552454.1 TonB-dependent receptor [Pseudomonas typographi]MBD1585544.1 TonB-dependent receptor [Pseudomonas typographi]MBD1597541.1 TonB-dependent receptor [Pseudomonas typographi]
MIDLCNGPRRWLPRAMLLAAPWSALPAAAAAELESTRLNTVTVTGNRLDRQSAQQPPASVTTIGGEQLESERINSIDDLQDIAPGLDVSSSDPYDTRVSLRGLGDGTDGEINIGMASSVGQYLDGVYLSRAGMIPRDLMDIDNIRVLSGPQGTLFGINTGGGVIDIHSRQPTFTPHASFSQSFGQRGYWQTRAMVSGPLSEHLAGRLNIATTNTDGNVENVRDGHRLNGSKREGLRGQLLFEPNEVFSLKAAVDYSSQTGEPTLTLYDSHAVDGVDQFLQKARQVGASTVQGKKVDLDEASYIRLEQGGGSLTAQWDFPSGYSLRSISGYRYFLYKPNSTDALSIPLYDTKGSAVHDRVWNQDLRLESPKGSLFDYVLGYSYVGENMDTFASTNYSAGYPTAWYGNTSYTNLSVLRWGELNEDIHSLFAQGTLHVTSAFDITAGARLTYEKKSGMFKRLNRANYDSGDLTEYHHLPSGTLNFSYRLTPHALTYLALSYSEKSGGLNVSAGAARSLKSTETLFILPETTRGAELGIKTDWLDNRVGFDVALFWTLVRNFQTTAYDWQNQTSYLTNAGDVRSRGAEAALNLKPTEHWSVNLGAAFLDVSYLSYHDGRCPPELTLGANAPTSCDLTGARAARAPKWTYNLRSRYEWDLGGVQAYVGGRYSYRSWSYGTLDNSEFTKVPGYGLLSLTTGLSGRLEQNQRWNASIWVNNALDKRYYRTLKAGDYGSAYGVLGEPRTVGMTVGVEF